MRIFVMVLFWLIVTSGFSQSRKVVDGFTMGTTYRIIYFDAKDRDLKSSIDSLLTILNKAISNYDEQSEVSSMNRSGTAFESHSKFLSDILGESQKVSAQSGGAFDVTVLPLVNAWGFGPVKRENLSQTQIDSIRKFVGYKKVSVEGRLIRKSDPRVQVDFGGIGQGYGVDVIASFLRGKGVKDFLVELGGEGLAQGRNVSDKRSWQIGVLDPSSSHEDQIVKLFVPLTDRAFTTSGNYFRYHEVNGRRVGHILDPRTGSPAVTDVLSATVFADNCTVADAWATAFIVMGKEKSVEYLDSMKELDAILIWSTEDGRTEVYATDRLQSSIIYPEN